MVIQYQTLLKTFEDILISKGFNREDAFIAAEIFARNSADGIFSHGVNRFPTVVENIDKGYIRPGRKAEREQSFGSFERWNGNQGLGPLNARICMDRTITLARENGIGIVAQRNTNHWMRGGTYGWQAADQGCIGLCWTNTMPNMPAWGAKDRRIGNNPFVMSIPRSNGRHVVVDLAMAQFSYGKIEEHRLNGTNLPFAGGYDTEGRLTTEPSEIEKTGRVLPAGFWKGSGLSMALDLIAGVLSAGNTVKDIGEMDDEQQISQVFIAVDPAKMNTVELTDRIINETLEFIKDSEPVDENGEIFFPGEREYLRRIKHMADGVPVIDSVWEKIQSLHESVK